MFGITNISCHKYFLSQIKFSKIFSPEELFLPVLRSLPAPVPDAVLSPWVQNSFQQRFIKKIAVSSPFIQTLFLLHKINFYRTKCIFHTKMYFYRTKYISVAPKCISISQNKSFNFPYKHKWKNIIPRRVEVWNSIKESSLDHFRWSRKTSV